MQLPDCSNEFWFGEGEGVDGKIGKLQQQQQTPLLQGQLRAVSFSSGSDRKDGTWKSSSFKNKQLKGPVLISGGGREDERRAMFMSEEKEPPFFNQGLIGYY